MIDLSARNRFRATHSSSPTVSAFQSSPARSLTAAVTLLVMQTVIFAVFPLIGVAIPRSVLLVDEQRPAPEIQVEMMPMWAGYCRKGRRLAVHVTLTARRSYDGGAVRIGLAGESGTGYWIAGAHPTVGIRRTFYLETLYSEMPLYVIVQRYDPGTESGPDSGAGTELFRARLVQDLTALKSDERLVVVCAEKNSPYTRRDILPLRHARSVFIEPNALPESWGAFDPVNLLILFDADPLKLTDNQRRAISVYLSNGGMILLVASDRLIWNVSLNWLANGRATSGSSAPTQWPAFKARYQLDDSNRLDSSVYRFEHGLGNVIAYWVKPDATPGEDISPSTRSAIRKQLNKPVHDTPAEIDRNAYNAFSGLYSKTPNHRIAPSRNAVWLLTLTLTAVFLIAFAGRKSRRITAMTIVLTTGIILAIIVRLWLPPNRIYATQLTIRYLSTDGRAAPMESYTMLNSDRNRIVRLTAPADAWVLPISEKIDEALNRTDYSTRTTGTIRLNRCHITPKPMQPIIRTILPNGSRRPKFIGRRVVLSDITMNRKGVLYRLRASATASAAFSETGFALLDLPYPAVNPPRLLTGDTLDGALNSEPIPIISDSSMVGKYGLSADMLDFVLKRGRVTVRAPRLIFWTPNAFVPFTLDGETVPVGDGWTVFIAELNAVRIGDETGR